MKFLSIFLLCLVIISCKETPKEIEKDVEVHEVSTKIDDTAYPEALQKIFIAHGGLSDWKNKRTLSYDLVKDEITEKHTIDLYSRNGKIEMPSFAMGFDGKDYWINDPNKKYNGDPIFYHNLMFYFYAMPFVLADGGIIYSSTEPLEFEGNSYPGIRISYNDGVGISAKDEYFIHYNPETFQMEWLGYTVTYRTGEISENIKWIRYNDWMDVNKLKLPKSITWYNYDGRTIKSVKSTRNFENVMLTEKTKTSNFYDVPENAVILTKK